MKTNKEPNKLNGVLAGITAALGMTMICVCVFAWLVHSEIIKENSAAYCVMATVLCSSFAGTWAATKKSRQNNLVICMITGAGYYAVLLIITILFYGGQFTGMAETGLLVLGGALCVFLCGFRGKQKPKSHKRLRYSG